MGFNLTFLIGNGFDINMGLKTSYKDFYFHVKDKYSNSNILNENIFFERIYNNVDDWQDFEKMLGILTCYDSDKLLFESRISSLDFYLTEKDRKSIINSIYSGKGDINFDTYYSSLVFFVKEFQLYVIEQQNAVINSMSVEDINLLLYSSLINYWKDFDDVSKEWYLKELTRKINITKAGPRIITSSSDEESKKFTFVINLNFLNFNYTSTLEKMIEKLPLQILESHFFNDISENLGNEILKDIKINVRIKNHHVHATTKTGMFLGVDNHNQINSNFCINVRNEELLIKPERVRDRFPSQLSKFEEILNETDLAYVYGMSFGETDKIWWKTLITKIQKDTNFKVAIHSFSPEKSLNIGDLSYDKNIDDIKNLLLRHDGTYFTSSIERELARQMRSQIIPVMTSKILFQQPNLFFWTELDAVELFEKTMFEDNNYRFFIEEFKNYSSTEWETERNEGDLIILSRKNIKNSAKIYYSFVYEREFVKIQFHGEESNFSKSANQILKVDRLSYLASVADVH